MHNMPIIYDGYMFYLQFTNQMWCWLNIGKHQLYRLKCYFLLWLYDTMDYVMATIALSKTESKGVAVISYKYIKTLFTWYPHILTTCST